MLPAPLVGRFENYGGQQPAGKFLVLRIGAGQIFILIFSGLIPKDTGRANPWGGLALTVMRRAAVLSHSRRFTLASKP